MESRFSCLSFAPRGALELLVVLATLPMCSHMHTHTLTVLMTRLLCLSHCLLVIASLFHPLSTLPTLGSARTGPLLHQFGPFSDLQLASKVSYKMRLPVASQKSPAGCKLDEKQASLSTTAAASIVALHHKSADVCTNVITFRFGHVECRKL